MKKAKMIAEAFQTLPTKVAGRDPLILFGLGQGVIGAAVLIGHQPIIQWSMSKLYEAGWHQFQSAGIENAVLVMGWGLLLAGLVCLTRFNKAIGWMYWVGLVLVTIVAVTPVLPGLSLPISAVIGTWALSFFVMAITSKTYLSTIYMRD